jgi:hypothetical protein
MQEGPSDFKKEFEEYLKEKKGQPIDSEVETKARREMAGGKEDLMVLDDESDSKIKEEIDAVEKEYDKKVDLEVGDAFMDEVEGMKREKKQIEDTRSYLNEYINEQKLDRRKMLVGEFMDFIDNDRNGFDPKMRVLVESYRKKYIDELDSENPVVVISDLLRGKAEEIERLLNPRPEARRVEAE